jgi:tRNA(fMet)-specific endonuclease VapC
VKYILDTNICVDYLTGRYPTVVEKIQASGPEDLRLSSVVVAELRYGADRSERSRVNHARIDVLVEEIGCVAFDLESAAAYGRLRARLEESGKLIGPNDMLIAAQALSLDLVLVTDNVDEFRRVRGLKLDNWRR